MTANQMKKSADLYHPVATVIKERKSLRAYDPRPIEPEKIKTLFEAARWAPSSSNEQPWMYIYATKEHQPELWEKLFSCLNDGNKLWAAQAPLLILSLTRTTFERNGMPNQYAHYDLGAANSHLALQATDLGLQLRQMGGFSQAKAAALLNIPDAYTQGAMIAVGYPGDAEQLPESLRLRELAPRERILQSEFTRDKAF
jgi:nitroreductase